MLFKLVQLSVTVVVLIKYTQGLEEFLIENPSSTTIDNNDNSSVLHYYNRNNMNEENKVKSARIVSKNLSISYTNKKEEAPRKFLQAYNSLNPVVLLIDSTKQSRNSAANFMTNLFRINPKVANINFKLMKFNESATSSIVETTNNNKANFMNLLMDNNSDDTPTSVIGKNDLNKTAAFFAILNAAHQLPPNSGILMFIGRGIEDEILAQHALIQVKNKQIRVYIIWDGDYPSNKNEERILQDLALHSNGNLFINTNKDLSRQYYREFLKNINNYKSASIILYKKKLFGEHNLLFPIDFDVTGIHISVTPSITTGILTTPTGNKINVLNSDEVAEYSIGSFTLRDPETNQHEIHLNTTITTTRDVGTWRLRATNAHALYDVTIFVHTNLLTNAKVTINNSTNLNETTKYGEKIVKLGVTGDISTISNISFIKEDGQILENNVKFNLNNDWDKYLTENINDIETNQKKEFNINLEKVPDDSFYAIINGKDVKGYNFTRLSYIRGDYTDNAIFRLPLLTVNVGLGSELITQPNRRPEIYFEITNNGNSAVLVRFFCKDEKYILLSMNPWYKWLSPQETATVRVTLITRSGSYRDLITFTAQSSESFEQKVIVDVGTTTQQTDNVEPEIDYHYTSDCTNYIFSNCREGTWTIEVKAKDVDSGLLQLTTTPKGIYFPAGFTAGTREQVTGYFSESCCNPDMQLIATDRQNNRKTTQVNAYRANWSPGAIAALVLGIILLLLVILFIVFCVRYLVKGKKSYDLPTYRGPATTSSSRRT